MKQFLTMKKVTPFNMYTCIEKRDYRFSILYQIFQGKFRPYELINWFFNEKQEARSTEWVYLEKEDNNIVLYDISENMNEEYIGPFLNPEYRFEMSKDNFKQLLHHWEELRISKPDTILIVIHEDNHVTLETDPGIIKQYQDAGYIFNINQHES